MDILKYCVMYLMENNVFKRVYIMFNVIICTIIIIIPFCVSVSKHGATKLNDTELLMTFMVLRHGDRSPIELNIKYVTDKEKVTNLVQKYGYGQLNDVGLRRAYKTGGFIRRRYDGFLSPQYNLSEVYIRSTDSTRAKMTILAAMAATYPVEESWCAGMDDCHLDNWTPVPYTTESGIHDFNLAVVNCPAFVTAYKNAFESPAPQMAKYNEFLDKWSKIIDFNITDQPSKAYLIYDVYTSQISLGVPLTPELEEIFPEIEEVAAAGIDVVFGNEENIALSAGVLLNTFFEMANKTISGDDVPKVHIYSGHDVNVYSFMVITRARPLQGVPKYGSVFALELRRVLATGQHVVVPVFLPTPDKYEVVYPQIEGCDDYCELSKFQELVSKFVLNVKEWKTQCEWSEDYDFDLTPIA